VLDHVGIEVGDYDASRAFYEMALAPLGLSVVMEPVPTMAGFGGSDRKPWFWVNARGRDTVHGVHLAFKAINHDAVDAFHAAALVAGGTDNGAPGPRPLYHPGYYGAFVLDRDGNNVEAVCHVPED
jgi:catechol 2,3-dioxygenase-like lactoylglutathione lyase family enzyme